MVGASLQGTMARFLHRHVHRGGGGEAARMSPPASDLDPASSRIESTHDNECAGSACHRAERALLTIAHTGLKSAKYGCSHGAHKLERE